MASITKADLIDRVASAASVTKAQAESVLSEFFGAAASAAKAGDKIAWPGFGSFTGVKRAARTGRNLRTGKPMKIAASLAMKFTSSQTLKDTLNGRGAKKAAPAKKAAGAKEAAKKTAKKR